MPGETLQSVDAALVVLVPEVEPLVSAFRQAHDPSAADGMPAHITINYPFLPGVAPEPDVEAELYRLFGQVSTISFAFTRLARFPDVLYLPPDPDAEFKKLIDLVGQHFPESLPYGGAITDIIPHLTVAQTVDQVILQSVERQLSETLEDQHPMELRAEEVWLMDNRSGIWETRRSYPLGQTG